ncbi:MAG TPA: hypothetical protein VI391_01995 [Thermoanaerobaculia bacterium]
MRTIAAVFASIAFSVSAFAGPDVVVTQFPKGAGSFGVSFPVVPLTNALGASQGTRFTGVDDTAQGGRSSLILAEVGGATTTVHVTLRFVFVAGQAVSSQAISSRDYTLNPGELRLISGLASDVIGDLRSSIGDLRNMQVDVDVTGGAGRVLPFIESTDNSSGDIMVRAD